MQTPDMPIDVLAVAAIIDVALSLLCPLPVAAGGTQPLCQLARCRCLQDGGMRSALLKIIVVVAVTPQSPPSPIPSICQMQTPDMPDDVFIINAVVDIALSSLCPPPVVGRVWHVLLLPPHVVIIVVVSTSSQGH